MMMTNNQRVIAQQQELIHRLSWSKNFACYNKSGFEEMKWPEIAHKARWIVYFDVDGVNAINKQFKSYDPFNAMMKAVLSQLRSTDAIAAQYNSGDEFLVCITEEIEPDGTKRKLLDPQKVVDRLTEELAKQGLTALFTVEQVKSLLLEENVKPAADRVLEEKEKRGVTR